MITSGACFYPCNGNPPMYQFGDMKAVYITGLMYLVEMLAPPLPGNTCGPPIPSYKSVSCKKEYLAPNGEVYIYNCQVGECCVQTLQYCEDTNGNPRLVKTDINVPNDDCVPDPDGSSCEFSCMWEWEESNVPKLGNSTIDNSLKNKYNLTTVNDINGIKVTLQGELEGKLSIILFDVSGQTIVDKSFNVNTDNFEHNMDLILPNGAYFISTTLNGQYLKSKKLIISK